MQRLLAKDPRFGQMSEQQARAWPDLMGIVEKRVRPEREKLKDNSDGMQRKKHWWLWGRYTPALFKSVENCERVLAIY